LDQRGDDMRYAGIELITRTVQVHRQKKDRAKPKLLAIRLSLDQEHLLGQTVGRVGFLRVSIPQVLLTERDRRVLRVGAHRPDGDELLDLSLPRDLHEVRAHDEIVVEEFAGTLAIRADAPHDRGQVDHDVGSQIGVHLPHRFGHAQVVLLPGRGEYLARAALLELVDHVGADEPGAPGDENPAAPPEIIHYCGTRTARALPWTRAACG